MIESSTPLHFSATLSGSWENDVKCDTSKVSHKKRHLKEVRVKLESKEEQCEGTVDWPFMLCTNVMYLTGKVGKIFTACTQPKWPYQVGIFDVSLQFLHIILPCKTPQIGDIKIFFFPIAKDPPFTFLSSRTPAWSKQFKYWWIM